MGLDVRRETDRLQDYIERLENAADAIAQAQALYPDPSLVHALDRLRSMHGQAAARFLLAIDEDRSPHGG